MVNELLSNIEKNKFYDELCTFVEEQFGEDIGVIAAENFLDFFMKQVGDNLYNRGIENSKSLFNSKIEDITFELDELKK
jgi:uncharacterized protein (DUF2164 family)